MADGIENRLRFISHRDKKILLIDFSHCTPEEILILLPEIQHLVTSEPRGSMLILTDFTGAQVSHDVADRIKQTLVFDRPHVKRSAFVGADKIPKVYLDAFKSFSRRDLPNFSSRQEALDWLAAS
ncbi:MAG TPA: STAS/SEC14 domain-containing protein [Terriglobales bacterium]|nr:STAS/SEC14 domain-containing protein [Terriglobales bacterium]